MTSWDPLCHWWSQICMEKSRHTTFPLSPPLVFGTTWYWGDGKPWRGWAQGDSGFIASRHSHQAHHYIWLVEYNGGPALLRLYRFLCQERTINAWFLTSKLALSILFYNFSKERVRKTISWWKVSLIRPVPVKNFIVLFPKMPHQIKCNETWMKQSLSMYSFIR
jgi:hypothetical protein